jgi:hypothetical protein
MFHFCPLYSKIVIALKDALAFRLKLSASVRSEAEMSRVAHLESLRGIFREALEFNRQDALKAAELMAEKLTKTL